MANADIVIDINNLVQAENRLQAIQNFYTLFQKNAANLSRSPIIQTVELNVRRAFSTADKMMTVFQRLQGLRATPVIDLEDQASGKTEDFSNKISESFNTGIIVDKEFFYEAGRRAGEAFSAGFVDGFDPTPIRAKAENAMDGAKSTPNAGGSLLDYAGPMLTVASGLLFGRRISKKNPFKKGPKVDAKLPAGKTADLDVKVPAGKTPDLDAKLPAGKTPDLDAKLPAGKTPDLDAKLPVGNPPDMDAKLPAGKAPDLDAKLPTGKAPDLDVKLPASKAASETAGNVVTKNGIDKPVDFIPRKVKTKAANKAFVKSSVKRFLKDKLLLGPLELIPDAIDFFTEKDGAKRTEIATSALGGFTAGTIGGAIGTALGSIILPGPGTMAGAVVGTALGGAFEWGGRKIGKVFGNFLNKSADRRREKKEEKKKEQEMLLQGGALVNPNPNPLPLPVIARKLAPTLAPAPVPAPTLVPAPGPRPDLNSINYDPQPSLSSPVQLNDQHMQAMQNQSPNVNVNANSELSLQPGAIQIHIETAQKENVDELVARLSARLTQELQQKFMNQRTVIA